METPPALNQVSLPRTAGIAITSLVLGILALSCFSVLTGIPALILGIMALNKINKSTGMLTGKGLGIAGIVMGSISIALLPFVLAINAALILPAVSNARAKAVEVQCMSNVRQCTLVCQTYAKEHDTALPDSWDAAKQYFANENSMRQVLHCRTEAGTTVSYEIVQPGKRLADLGHPEETIIVREITAPHHGKRAVGFADGHVEMHADK